MNAHKKSYNRICVTLTDENYDTLVSLVGNTNKRLNILNQSNVVNLGLNKLFDGNTKENIANEIQKQLVVD